VTVAVKVRQKKGKHWVVIDHRGQRKSKCIGDKRTAEKVAKQIEARLALGDLGILDEGTRRPFDEYYKAWLDSYVKAHCKDATYEVYETGFRLYLEPAFGKRDIGDITRENVKQVAYTMLSQGKSRTYVKGTLAPLVEMFNHAVEDGHVPVNPALRILRRSRDEEGKRREKIAFLSRDELVKLLDACQKFFPAFFAFVLCLARTGMRVGEAVALQRGDIDFNGRFADVRRAINDGKVSTPKSGKSRLVDLSAQLTKALKAHLTSQKAETLKKGWKEVPEWVFTNEAGNPLNPDNFRNRVWPKLLAKAGLRKIRIHDLRHTYASLLIAQGESLASVKDQMGHHSIRVTVDTYGHLVPGGNKAAVDRLDDELAATTRNLSATSLVAAELGAR
jgi:integrase